MERARQIIKEVLAGAAHPAVLSSFGKDSMLLLSIVREVGESVPVIWFHAGLTPAQERFAKRMILDLNLEAWSWLPSDVYALPNGEGLSLVREQAFGAHRFPVVSDVEGGDSCVFDFPPERTPTLFPHFDALLTGYRDSDSHGVLGTNFCPSDGWRLGKAKVYAPLRHMTDVEVWDAIHQLGVPYDAERYDLGASDPDTFKACHACLLEGESATVYCPKADENIPRRNWHPRKRLREFQRRFGFEEAA